MIRPATILLTGADGHVARNLARRLLDLTGASLYLWCRASSDREATAKRAALLSFLGEDRTARARATLYFGDLHQDFPFAGVPVDFDAIIHAAAVTRFNVEPDLADATNIDGTRKLAQFAERSASLRHLYYVSTIYASGQRPGLILEEIGDATPEFANHYERSKCASERLLSREFASLAPVIVRIPTLIADAEDGSVSQYNVFHNTLRLLYNGLLSVLPGRRETPLYFATTAYVVQGVLAILQAKEPRPVYHVCHDRRSALTFGELLDLCYDVFLESPAFRSKRILKPTLADERTFSKLAGALLTLSEGIVSNSLKTIIPFAPQLYIEKSVSNDQFRALSQAPVDTDFRAVVPATVHQLVATAWGRRS